MVEVGANWMHYHGLEPGQENPLRRMIENAGLNTVEDPYTDYIFRYKGLDVTSQYEKIYQNLSKAEEGAIDLASKKISQNESDVSFRTAFSLHGWNPQHPIHFAAEWFDFDFEFADTPDVTSLKANYRVLLTFSEYNLTLSFRPSEMFLQMISLFLTPGDIPRLSYSLEILFTEVIS